MKRLLNMHRDVFCHGGQPKFMARAQTYDEPVLKDAGLEWLADDAAWDDFPLRWRGVSRSGCVQEQLDDLSWHSAKDLASDAVGAGCSTIFQN